MLSTKQKPNNYTTLRLAARLDFYETNKKPVPTWVACERVLVHVRALILLYSGVNEERYFGLARELRAAAARRVATAQRFGDISKAQRDAACRRHPK